jgi:integrase
MIQQGKYKPHTVRDWWKFFRSIMLEASVDFEIADPTAKIPGISLKGHRTYPKGKPNRLTPAEFGAFLKSLKRLYPQHVAPIMLGIATGRRPCELRPLRRKGPNADINWQTGVIEIRRSSPRTTEIRERTKTDEDLTIKLTGPLVAILADHVAHLKGRALASDWLFPSQIGTMKQLRVWSKAIKAAAEDAGIDHPITPRMMRRTYNDLVRVLKIHKDVQKSMSGHKTDDMISLYSTVDYAEQEKGLTQIMGLLGSVNDSDKDPGEGEGGAQAA